MEHALDPVYAARCGVNIDQLLISQPDTGEQALEIAETLVRSGAVDLVVVDSVAALVPRSEIEGDMGDPTMGVQARLMSQALRKLSGAINQTKTAVVFTNQLRQKIGVMFGSPEGISKAGDILDLATSLEVVEKRGSFYSYKDSRLGQGREASKNFLNQNPELMKEIENTIRSLGSVDNITGSWDSGEETSAEGEDY